MRIGEEIRRRVVELDSRYRSSWDVRSIAHVTGIGRTTVAKILKEARGPRPKPSRAPHERRTWFLRRDVMWSTDFMELPGKRWLIKTLDEMSRFRPGWGVVLSQTAEAAVGHGEDMILRMGKAPLIWKYDHGSPFTSDAFQDFLARHKILPYPTPPRAPWANGRVERDHQEIQNWLIPVADLGLTDEQMEREVDEGMFMLNFVKPRAVLGFRTSADTYFHASGLDDWQDVDREHFRMNVEDLKCQLGLRESERTHRKAIQLALQEWELYKEWEETPREAKFVNRSEPSDVVS